MKPTIAIAICLSLFTTSVSVFASHADDKPIHVISVNKKNLFVFKTLKGWRGAMVNVVDENGESVSNQRLMKPRMVIDFSKLKQGVYKIRITKHGHTEELQYVKK